MTLVEEREACFEALLVQIRAALEVLDLFTAEWLIQDAKEVDPQHPSLKELEADYYFKCQNWKAAMQIYAHRSMAGVA